MSVSDDHTSNWTDLPGAFLCHILSVIPNKRAEVKSVCRTWRASINSSLNEVRIPAADMQLLQQLPNIKQLTVFGTAAKRKQQQDTRHKACTWPPRSCYTTTAATPAAATGGTGSEARAVCNTSNSNAGQINCWGSVDPQLLNRLKILRLQHCPEVAQHLAKGLWQPTSTASTCASSSNCSIPCQLRSWTAPFPVFAALRILELNAVGNVSSLLAALKEHRAASAQHQTGSSSCQSSMHASAGPALGQLQELHLVDWSLDCCYSGCTTAEQLQLLSELPELHTLQLSGCGWLHEVPAAVLRCGGLTRLLLCNNDLLSELPGGITQLTALQVLDLSASSMLRSLGPGLSKLTSLTELNLSGPTLLWADHSTVASSTEQQNAQTAAASHTAGAHHLPTVPCPAQLFIAKLSHLVLPSLPHQQQHQLLSELASLQQLRRLVLSRNTQLMVLPAAVAALTGLLHLDVTGCALRWLGEDVLQCAALQELLLGDNVLAELPDEISRLQELRVLDIGACGALWHLPSSLLHLPKLGRIVVPSKAIGQHVLEQLECRQEAVEVDMDPVDIRLSGWAVDAHAEYYTDSEGSDDLESGELSSDDDADL